MKKACDFAANVGILFNILQALKSKISLSLSHFRSCLAFVTFSTAETINWWDVSIFVQPFPALGQLSLFSGQQLRCSEDLVLI